MLTLSKRIHHTISMLLLLAGFMAASVVAPVRAAAPTPTSPPPSGAFAEALKDNKLTIAFVPQCASINIFTLARKGAQAKASELSKAGPYKVEILDYSQGNCSNPEPQMKKMNAAIEKKVEAIIMSCISADACRGPIDTAVGNGIPVVTFDTDSPDSKRLTSYGIDNFESGKLAAQLLAEAFPDGGDVALFKAYGTGVYQPRILGFQEGIKETKLKIVTDVTCTADCWDETPYLIEGAMKDFPGLSGWLLVSPTPIIHDDDKLIRWKAATQKGMKTIAFDAMQDELRRIKSGKLYAVVDQPYWGWGYDTVQIVYDHMVNGKTFEKNVYVKSNIITKKNVDALLKMWNTSDFSKPLPPYK